MFQLNSILHAAVNWRQSGDYVNNTCFGFVGSLYYHMQFNYVGWGVQHVLTHNLPRTETIQTNEKWCRQKNPKNRRYLRWY